MKKLQQMARGLLLFFMASFINISLLHAQDNKDNRIIDDSRQAKEEFMKSDKLLKSLFDDAYGYVIFPNVGKAAAGIGGAAGNGILFEKGKMVGSAKMKQLSVGLQMGGQVYSEVIFFENKESLDKFKEGNFEFSGQASAVAITEGVSTNLKYREGVMVFTKEKGGLMYEASLGGQKFEYTAYNK